MHTYKITCEAANKTWFKSATSKLMALFMLNHDDYDFGRHFNRNSLQYNGHDLIVEQV